MNQDSTHRDKSTVKFGQNRIYLYIDFLNIFFCVKECFQECMPLKRAKEYKSALHNILIIYDSFNMTFVKSLKHF